MNKKAEEIQECLYREVPTLLIAFKHATIDGQMLIVQILKEIAQFPDGDTVSANKKVETNCGRFGAGQSETLKLKKKVFPKRKTPKNGKNIFDIIQRKKENVKTKGAGRMENEKKVKINTDEIPQCYYNAGCRTLYNAITRMFRIPGMPEKYENWLKEERQKEMEAVR